QAQPPACFAGLADVGESGWRWRRLLDIGPGCRAGRRGPVLGRLLLLLGLTPGGAAQHEPERQNTGAKTLHKSLFHFKCDWRFPYYCASFPIRDPLFFVALTAQV